MKSIALLTITALGVQAFTVPVRPPGTRSGAPTSLRAVEIDAERLLRKARALREQVQQNEKDLHTTLIERKKERDASTDKIIECLFPSDPDDGGTGALCARLRRKRLASDQLVAVVERLHEREVAAKGLEHVEPQHHESAVTFERVSSADEAELTKIAGLIDKLIEAAEVLDQEFVEHQSEGEEAVSHADRMHWGAGNAAGILKDKAKELGREYDDQFQKRLESFYDAVKRKHTRDEVNRDDLMGGDLWK